MDRNDQVILETAKLIHKYADIVCEDDFYKDDIISDSIVETIKIVNRDKNGKLTAKDIFNGWIKDVFDETMKKYMNRKRVEIPFSDVKENKDIYDINMQRDIDVILKAHSFLRDNDIIYVLLEE